MSIKKKTKLDDVRTLWMVLSEMALRGTIKREMKGMKGDLYPRARAEKKTC